MAFTKIRLPKSDAGARAFAELAKENRVVGIREHGEVVYQVPDSALDKLNEMSVPYEVVAAGLSNLAGPTEVH